ncbi:MAG TPA: Gfo/Idh/MocA family oxidoreductase, partial [Vicinamibacterales bacterium]|nr:Gfo/Idh/MocA family oxidoreductase [Vicinamibacterales bacterium]
GGTSPATTTETMGSRGAGRRSPVLRVAVVGCGKAAENHVVEIQKLSGASVGAVCDAEPLMAEQLAVRYGIRQHYSLMDAMLEAERPDVVHIATPPESHLPLAVKAMDAGCHVFVEKPLTLCYADSQTLVAHATSCDRKLTIGYGYYFDPIARTLREAIAQGVLGEPVHIESFLGYSLAGQFGSAVFADGEHWVHRLPGKLIHNVIDHLLNKVAGFLSDRATVHARAWQHDADRHPAWIMPDELRVMFVDANISAFATFTSQAQPLAHFLNVYGTKNSARLDFETGTITFGSMTVLPGPFGRLSRTFAQSSQYFRQGTKNAVRFVRSDYHALAGLNFLIDAFYESIRQDAPVPVPYQDILKVAAMTEAVFAQLEAESSLAV